MNNVGDPFEETEFKGYMHMNPKQKGEYGEQRISETLRNGGYNVEPRKKNPDGTTDTGHDRIVDGFLTEMKFSLASKGKFDVFTLNHVSKGKNWDRLIFVGINLHEENRMYWMSKDAFIEDVDSDKPLFSYGQGGKKIKNDDYMITGRNLMGLVTKGIFRTMDEW